MNSHFDLNTLKHEKIEKQRRGSGVRSSEKRYILKKIEQKMFLTLRFPSVARREGRAKVSGKVKPLRNK
jgi:hypothetical protein